MTTPTTSIAIGTTVRHEAHDGIRWTVTGIARGWYELTDQHGAGDVLKARAAQLELVEDEQDDAYDDEQDDESSEGSSKLAKTIAKYRDRYVPTLAASGKKSLSNGDQLAMILSGMEPDDVCRLADVVLLVAIGTHKAKYAKLNKGQQRMNAGNRIRAAIKRGDAEIYEEADLNGLWVRRVEQDAE